MGTGCVIGIGRVIGNGGKRGVEYEPSAGGTRLARTWANPGKVLG